MYIILVYDVSVERVAKVCQFLRKYLNWMQNSVFEGELTESEMKRVEMKLKDIIDKNQDSIIIYRLPSNNMLERESIGIKKAEPTSVI